MSFHFATGPVKHHVMSCHVMSCHVTLCHVASCNLCSCHVWLVFWHPVTAFLLLLCYIVVSQAMTNESQGVKVSFKTYNIQSWLYISRSTSTAWSTKFRLLQDILGVVPTRSLPDAPAAGLQKSIDLPSCEEKLRRRTSSGQRSS